MSVNSLSVIIGRYFAYLSLVSVFLSASLFILNRVYPIQGRDRVDVHCALGFLGFFGALVNFLLGCIDSKIFTGIQIFLLVVIVVTGFLLKYIRNAGALRYQSSSVHPVIALALFLVLIFNWLRSRGFL